MNKPTISASSFIMKRIEYQKGQTVGNLIFIREVDRIRPLYRRALFKCHCGGEFETDITPVRSGNTKSCGCRKGFHKHGLTYTQTWYMYNSMIRRCYNPDTEYYSNYGGRGIKVCKEWRDDIKTFHDYMAALPNAWVKGYSIDRYPNNDGDYEPGNVRWATKHEQAANQNVRNNSKTGIKGVFFNKEKGKYLSEITVYKKRHNLGYHNTKEEALQARNNFIIKNELWEYPIQKI
jgi:hypothetical protein